ncbi:MAG: hypothetical protein ABL915_09915, partial [Gallionella sp.]
GRNQTYNNAQGLLVRKDGTVATDGVAHGLDFSTNRHALVRLDYDAWQLKLIAHERAITPSSAPFLSVFDDPSLRVTDGGHQLSLSHQPRCAARCRQQRAGNIQSAHGFGVSNRLRLDEQIFNWTRLSQPVCL